MSVPGRRARIGSEERRARLGTRHRLAAEARTDAMIDVARAVVSLHATDPATVYLSAWARLRDPSIGAIDRALYEERVLIRMLAMRRTMFVVPVTDAPVLHAAVSRAVARGERRRNREIAALLGEADVDGWLAEVEGATLAALGRLGEATARELTTAVPALRRKVRVNVGRKYEGEIGVSSRVLLQLAAEGRIVRARPRGSWISSQYRWTPMERWLGCPLADLPTDEAQADLVRRWLARFGPGTEADLRWWMGLTAREIRAALARIGAVEVDLDEGRGLVLPDDLDPTPRPAPWVALLPSLDATTMGWQVRDWYLGPHRPALFDTNGNAGPTVWADGRIVGGWATRIDGEVVYRLLEDVGTAAAVAVEAEADRLTRWLRAVQVVPRFPTPLGRELIG